MAMDKKLRYVVVDPQTNSIVLEKDAREAAHPASLTKLLTMAITMEAATLKASDFGNQVTVPSKEDLTENLPIGKGQLATSRSVKPGKEYSLPAALAWTGNNSEAKMTAAIVQATADAYNFTGSYKERDQQVLDHANLRLKEIGLENTDMRVFTGWKNNTHHTTALDIAITMDYMQSNFPKSTMNGLSGIRPNGTVSHSSAMVAKSARTHGNSPDRTGAIWGKTGKLNATGRSQALYYISENPDRADNRPLIVVVTGTKSIFERDKVTRDILTQAYDIINKPGYTAVAAYEDVKFNPDAALPTKSSTGQSASTPIISAEIDDAPAETVEIETATAPETKVEIEIEIEAATEAETIDETEAEETIAALPRTPEGYVDLSMIPPERLPLPQSAPDRTIRFPLCDAPPSLVPDEIFGNAPRLTRAFSTAEDGENTAPPQTDEEMYAAVYSEMLRDKMIHEEGNNSQVYKDSLGFPTVGIGHLLGGDGDYLLQGPKLKVGDQISDLCVDRLFEQDTSKSINAAIAQARDIGVFERDFVTGLVSMNFQLGTGWPKEWPKAYNHLKDGNFESAMIEFIASDEHRQTSKWLKQTPYRVLNALKVMANEITEDRSSAENTITQQESKIAELQATIAELTTAKPETKETPQIILAPEMNQ